jgi:2,3,4,5-tetrahydropyridine-2-carboxylate N-succinyltransferase
MDKKKCLEFFADLESGKEKIVEHDYKINYKNKEKILQAFKVLELEKIESAPFVWQDKIPLRKLLSARVIPGAVIRSGAYIADDAIIMPSFINIGAYVGSKTMIDSYATIGSCAYVGSMCHISSGAVIAGVLEPISENPVIIEDNVFVGAQCVISEGVRIGKGAVIGTGVHLTSSVKIIDRATGKEYDHVPPYSVVVPGAYRSGDFFISCAIIAKVVDEQARSKVSVNNLLR